MTLRLEKCAGKNVLKNVLRKVCWKVCWNRQLLYYSKSTTSHHKYKIYRNKLTGLLRLSKKLYYRNYFLANQSNIKNVWKGIRQLVTLKPKESFKPSRIVIDNQEITDTKTIANEFNNYFATIGSRLAAQILICGTRTHKF